MLTADEVIAALGLRPLPVEGGYYRETYRAAFRLPADAPGPACLGGRAASAAIYYLLTPDTFSALHRLLWDEVFHFYLGDPVEMLLLGPGPADGGRVLTLGTDLRAGQAPQAVVIGGVWQGSALAPGGRFGLLGTTVAPGFEFADYEAGDRAALQDALPEFADRVCRLTR